MSKPVLGRGLGKLLEAKGSAPPEKTGAEPTKLSPGMATLLKGPNGSPNENRLPAADERQRVENGRRRRLLQTSLVLADVLLFALAARLVFKSGGHFGFLEAMLCVAAIGLGAWLSCLALWREKS